MIKEIKFKGHFNPNKQVISIDGDGASIIKFTADATQLAEVIRSLAIFKENLLEIKIRKVTQTLRNEKKRPQIERRAFKG